MVQKFTSDAFAGGVLSPEIHNKLDFTKTPLGLAEGVNCLIDATGSVFKRGGTQFLFETKFSEKLSALKKFSFSRSQGYALEFGEEYIRFYRDGAILVDGSGNPVEVVSPYAAEDVAEIDYAQSHNTLYIVHPKYPIKKLTRVSDTSWTLSDMVFNPSVNQVASVSLSHTGTITVAFNWQYSVCSVSKEGKVGMTVASAFHSADIELSDTPMTVSFTSPSDVSDIKEYQIFRKKGKYFYLVGVVTDTGTGATPYTFLDSGLEAEETVSPPIAFNDLQNTNNYPRCVGFINQRLVFAGSYNEPDTIWASRVGEYNNFTNTPAMNSNEAIKRVLSSGQMLTIKFLVSKDDLIAFCEGGAWRIKGNSDETLSAYEESDVACGSVKPIKTKKSVLFIEGNENTVSDFRYLDTVAGYDGDPQDILSRHLFEGYELKSMCFQSSPYGIVIAPRSDGVATTLTYMKNQNVYAWTEGFKTDGSFESVVNLDKKNFSETYAIVKRTINGQTKRYVELLRHPMNLRDTINDAFYVDSGLQYNGTAVSTVSGLDHLEGKTVICLCDGNVIYDKVVTSGSISFDNSYSSIVVGLPYTFRIRTIKTDYSQIKLNNIVGSSVGVPRSVKSVNLSVSGTRGIFAGTYRSDTDEEFLIEYPSMNSGEIGLDVPMITDTVVIPLDSDSLKENSVIVEQRDPTPIKILSITHDIVWG